MGMLKASDKVGDLHQRRDATAAVYVGLGIAGPASDGVLLKALTEPVDLVEADEGCGKGHEGEVDVLASLVTDDEAAEAGHPCQGSLNNPAVTSKPLAAVDAGAGDARRDAALA
jgi:hypothetical protein